jgi:hypothetical protein
MEMRVSSLSQNPDQPLRDDPASNAYSALADRFSEVLPVEGSFNVYQLEPPSEAAGVMLGWAGQGAVAAADNPAVPDEHRPSVSAFLGSDQEFQLNVLSGAQLWVNRALFHREAGVDPSTLLSEAAYVQKARSHMLGTLGQDAGKLPLYTYKSRKYFNSVGNHDGSVPVTTTVYQVAIAFNASVDGLPVIGPGGKISVQLAPDGTPVQHESTIRGISGVLAAVPAASIIAPEAARADLEKTLSMRGVLLDQYKPSRSEFGYFRRGAGSVQNVIGPYYAFFYDSVSGYQKGIEEHVPATNDPASLKLLQDDENLELARIAVLVASARPPDKRSPH